MEVGQGPNWGCSAKEKKIVEKSPGCFTFASDYLYVHVLSLSRFQKLLLLLFSNSDDQKME
jgi:hypothetical protein